MITHGIIVDRWLCKGYSLNIPFRVHFSSLLDGPWPLPQPVGIQGTVAQAAAGVVKHIPGRPLRVEARGLRLVAWPTFFLVTLWSTFTVCEPGEIYPIFRETSTILIAKSTILIATSFFLRAKSTISICHVQWFSIANCEFLPEINPIQIQVQGFQICFIPSFLVPNWPPDWSSQKIHHQWFNDFLNRIRLIGGTYHRKKDYLLGLNFREYPHNSYGQTYGTNVPPL